MPICDCGFKYTGNTCPMCQAKKKPEKMKTYYIKARSQGRVNMAEVFREYVQYRYPGYAGEPVPCDNCEMIIHTIKFENVSHIEPKSLSKHKEEDFENLEILCGPTDYWGKVDRSCHTLWERNDFESFNQKTKGNGKTKIRRKSSNRS